MKSILISPTFVLKDLLNLLKDLLNLLFFHSFSYECFSPTNTSKRNIASYTCQWERGVAVTHIHTHCFIYIDIFSDGRGNAVAVNDHNVT